MHTNIPKIRLPHTHALSHTYILHLIDDAEVVGEKKTRARIDAIFYANNG